MQAEPVAAGKVLQFSYFEFGKLGNFGIDTSLLRGKYPIDREKYRSKITRSIITCKKCLDDRERELKDRTRKFAINIFKLVDKLPNRRSANIIGNQLGDSGSSVAANYRVACRGRSHAEFTAKIGIVEEEADESVFWLDMLIETGNSPMEETEPLLAEARELTAIFTTSSKTAKQNRSKYNKQKNPHCKNQDLNRNPE